MGPLRIENFAKRFRRLLGSSGAHQQGFSHQSIGLDVLARIAECLTDGEDFAKMLQCAFDIVAAQLGEVAFASYLLERDVDVGYLILVASCRLNETQKSSLQRVELKSSLAGAVVLQQRPIVMTYLEDDTSPLTEVARHLRLKAFAGFPLMRRERVSGVVIFGSLNKPFFEPDELTLMQSVTLQVAAAMERMRLEQTAKMSETRLRLALKVGGMGAWSWDWAKDLLDPDPHFLRLHGIDPVEHRSPDTATLMSHVHVDDRQTVEDALLVCARGRQTLRCDYRVVLSGNTVRWLTTYGSPVTNSDGSVTSLVGLTQDITATVDTREGLKRKAAESERLAEHRAVALAASEDQLIQASKMEALGRLAGGIAHDFNNVLQAVEGSASMALHNVDTDPETTKRFLRLAADACARGASVTERLLAFGRRSPLRSVAIDVAFLLRELADMLRPTLGPHIVVMVEGDDGLPSLVADRSQLETVLVNLANNARDAMTDGGRLILSADLMPQGAGGTGRPGSFLRLRVIDEGTGVTPEVLRRLSEPFFTTKPVGKGTGLGLAMARGFAEQSGGTFAIDSTLGRGTTVTLLLPVALANTADVPSLPQA